MLGLAEFYHGDSKTASARIIASPTLRRDEDNFARWCGKILRFTFA
jgi:hypothetical protein